MDTKTGSTKLAGFPSDVIRVLLCRLPVEDLLQFRLLSKQWRTTIESPDFIREHLAHTRLKLHKSIILEGFIE
ncbi:hypothetical protein CCACVL1_03726 [Corchorus capsularis]|uniref:F-box domain-containing protein n=1 Tax=Corchorus capsularis TaxID=210143 RepID=A0A1R3JXI7_COCAP|nr:hypothetical protein CCACVL1_03726 [Corchorus capsularis]